MISKSSKSAHYQFADGSNLQMQRMTAKRAATAASLPVDERQELAGPACVAHAVDRTCCAFVPSAARINDRMQKP